MLPCSGGAEVPRTRFSLGSLKTQPLFVLSGLPRADSAQQGVISRNGYFHCFQSHLDSPFATIPSTAANQPGGYLKDKSFCREKFCLRWRALAAGCPARRTPSTDPQRPRLSLSVKGLKSDKPAMQVTSIRL